MSARPEGAPVTAGLTFDVGWMHQPVEQLGVLGMIGARLTTGLNVPVEAADFSPNGAVEVVFSAGQAESSLAVVGRVAAVCDALRRVDELLSQPIADAFLDSLRDRSWSYPNPLTSWNAHLVTRWPGHRPHLSALGPHALETLSGTALTDFATTRLVPARRVYWTNEQSVADVLGDPRVRALGGPPADGIAPPDWPDGPGCVTRFEPGQLFSVALRNTPATRVGLAVLARTLHRRLVDMEPLATTVRIVQRDIGGDVAVICADADLLPGKEVAVTAAVAQTVQDLAAGLTSPEQIAQARETCVRVARAAPHEAQAMVSLSRRQLQVGDFPTPDTVAAEYQRVSDDQVKEALAGLLPGLLLATEGPGDWPAFPTVDRDPILDAEGARFRDWTGPASSVRCSDRRVGTVEKRYTGQGIRRRLRPVTLSSVDFEQVVLRMDAGEARTTLVDRRLRSVRLMWGAYQRADKLRELVDRHTANVPVIEQAPDPQAALRVARAARKRRRARRLLPVWAVGALALIVGLSVLTNIEPRPVHATVGEAETVTLPNGTTLRLVGRPELIEHYNADIANLYAVRMRMCGGEDKVRDGFHEARNYFAKEKFRLRFGDQAALQRWTVSERPEPLADYVAEGECATGWLLFDLPEPPPTQPIRLHYTNIEDDDVAWRMPAEPPISPLSKPCPEPSRDQLPWIGCPGG